MPFFSIIMLLMTLANMAVPLSCNFVGEFLSLLAAFEYSLIGEVLASLGMVLGAAYSLYLYNRVCFGNTSNFILFSRDLNRREFYALFPLVFLDDILSRAH